jgi:sec-independent protein translocase protein TatA
VVGDILQPTHLLFILVIALLVLGPKRLPEVGKSLGRGLRDFRQAISGEDRDDEQTDFMGNLMAPETPTTPAPAPEATAQTAPPNGQAAPAAASPAPEAAADPVDTPTPTPEAAEAAAPAPEPAGVAASPASSGEPAEPAS